MCIEFITQDLAEAFGYYGRILKSTDGGENWVSKSSGTINDINDISFTDFRTGTLVGNQGTILRTINGGLDWVEQSSGTSLSLFGVSF